MNRRMREYAPTTDDLRIGSRRRARTTQTRTNIAPRRDVPTAAPVKAAATSTPPPTSGAGQSMGRHAAVSANTKRIGIQLVYDTVRRKLSTQDPPGFRML